MGFRESDNLSSVALIMKDNKEIIKDSKERKRPISWINLYRIDPKRNVGNRSYPCATSAG